LGGNKESDKKVDDPKKADLVSSDVTDFYNSLETAVNSGGLRQQSSGSMTYQKEVESMQIGLKLLGYDLPRHGVDGLFGPETAMAVKQFNQSNNILKETAQEIRTTLDDLGYDEKGSELSSGGDVTDNLSSIVSDVLKDFKATKPNVKVTVTAGNDKYHKNVGYKSKHVEGNAVDLVISPYNTENSNAFIGILNKYKSKDNMFGYIDEYKNPSSAATGGHFHLQYGKGGTTGKSSENTTTFASPEMLNKLIELLKTKGITSEDLKKHIDTVLSGGGVGFTDIDLSTNEGFKKYADICQKFINMKQPNPLGITGNMLAKSAKYVFDRYRKFVPAELALAQLTAEGGIGNKDVNSRPIKTKNPFNVGNVDSGNDVYSNDVQKGIDTYYTLIATNYLGKGKTANDLVSNFVNKDNQRYASNTNYETVLNSLVKQANSVASSIA
jgi:peptidoglycan hydrolase-like protein with peptidoglycan-binding domain